MCPILFSFLLFSFFIWEIFFYDGKPELQFLSSTRICWIHIRGELMSLSICTSMYKIEFQITHLLFSYFWCLIRRLTMWYLFAYSIKIERIPILKIIFSCTIHKHLCVTHLLWEIMYIVNAQKSLLQISDQSLSPLKLLPFSFFSLHWLHCSLFLSHQLESFLLHPRILVMTCEGHLRREREREHGL